MLQGAYPILANSLVELLFSHCDPIPGEFKLVRNGTLYWTANHNRLHVEALHHIGHADKRWVCTRGKKTRLKFTPQIDEVWKTVWASYDDLREGFCLAWNDICVGDTRESLETVALVVFTGHPDEEALRGGAKLWQSPQSMLMETSRRWYGDGA